MARIYQEQLKRMEENPIYQFCQDVLNMLPNWLTTEELKSMRQGPMSPFQYVKYLVFEAVAEKTRNDLKSEKSSIYRYVEDLHEKHPEDIFLDKDSIETRKKASRDLKLRKAFLIAEMQRHKIPWNSEALNWMCKEGKGYPLTPLQLEQLHDKESLSIKKVHGLRRLQNPKHATNADIISYYDMLTKHAQNCKHETVAKQRVLCAINLNDFENRCISFFLYHIAKYCIEQGIKEIDDKVENNLLALSGTLTYESWTVTHKPVLSIREYIPAAIKDESFWIKQYEHLVLRGLKIRKIVLERDIQDIRYTYEDLDDFICSEWGYNIFELYSDLKIAEEAKRKEILALLRVLIGKLAIDPLST